MNCHVLICKTRPPLPTTLFSVQCLWQSWVPQKQLIIFRHSHLWEFERDKDLEMGIFILMMEVWACSKEGQEREFTLSMVLLFSLVFSLSSKLIQHKNTIEPFLCCLLNDLPLNLMETVLIKTENVANLPKEMMHCVLVLHWHPWLSNLTRI